MTEKTNMAVENHDPMTEPESLGLSDVERVVSVYDELKFGGKWLGAARSWLQSNVRKGDTLNWSSCEQVSIPFCDLEDFARCVAIAAVTEDRKNREH